MVVVLLAEALSNRRERCSAAAFVGGNDTSESAGRTRSTRRSPTKEF